MLLQFTARVTGAGAGVDSVWEQKKLEARKMLLEAAESHKSTARFVRQLLGEHHLFSSLSIANLLYL